MVRNALLLRYKLLLLRYKLCNWPVKNYTNPQLQTYLLSNRIHENVFEFYPFEGLINYMLFRALILKMFV